MLDDDEEVRGLPWWMGFAAGMTFGGIMVAFPVLITISNMHCTIFGFPL